MSEDLLSDLLPIKRARGYRLYDVKGNRYLDFYQNGGRGFLGHGASHLTRVLKNELSKGLLFDMPSLFEHRLIKALSQFLPDYTCFRIFSSMDNACRFMSTILDQEIKASDIGDPALNSGNFKGPVAYFRPFAEKNTENTDFIIPVIPFSVMSAPVVVGWQKEYNDKNQEKEVLSPVFLAGAARSIHDMMRISLPEWYKNDLINNRNWVQNGIYVRACFESSLYPSVFREFLNHGFLLSPRYPGPSVLPFRLSDGELKKMTKLFAEIPGN
ncbi:MAG: hypothetical protein JW969_16970 [Spirochaetales bacterium]|nr:hypothetical protein [Spirochaetales bacterium]